MKQPLFALLILTSLLGASPPVLMADDLLNDIRERALIEKGIAVYGKYSNALPMVADLLMKSAPKQQGGSEQLEPFLQHAREYAKNLAADNKEDINRITVRNEEYWKTILVLTADNTALSARLFCLMSKGLLKRAEIVLLFCAYDVKEGYGIANDILNTVGSDINTISENSDHLVNEGIKKWEKGDTQGAIELYHQALGIYPKNPKAIYEISLGYLSFDSKGELTNEKAEPYYALIRSLDPHFSLAYQGEISPLLRRAYLALVNKVEPSFKSLWTGENALINMRNLADGYFEMEEYELALYAYKYLLFHTYRGGFDPQLVSRIENCLTALEMQHLIIFLNQWLIQIERIAGKR